MRPIATTLAAALVLAGAAEVEAQSADAGDEAITPEEPDATRLDVERLPPEAIQVNRGMYAHGLYLEAQLGGIFFLGGVGEVATPGPWARLALGIEVADFFHIVLSGEASFHQTDAPAPPRPTAFELLGAAVALRLQANFTPEFAMWIAPEGGIIVATTDILDTYGIQDASTVFVMYGGQLGIDYHVRSRHHSFGVLGGVRHYPSLEGFATSAPALGVHVTLYLRYTF